MRLALVCLGWALGLSSIGAAAWVIVIHGMPAPIVAFGAGMLFLITALNWWIGLGK